MPSRRLVHPLTGKANSLRRAAEIVFVVVGLFSSQTAELVAQPACGASAPCVVSGGTYLARAPARWDGRSPLPAVVFFHGWGQSAADVMRDEAMARVLSELGVLLVAPDGVQHSWSFPGSPESNRDEFGLIQAVLDDVESRFPIDRRRLWASGFSQGASMVWYAACYLGDRFAAFASVAGDFWEPEPNVCPSGPVSILHIHGLADETFPLEGRVVRERYRQGNLWRGWALWRHIDGCPISPDGVDASGNLTCETWRARSCSSRRELMLCFHTGGHVFDAEWIRAADQWVASLAERGASRRTAPSPRGRLAR